MNKKTMLIFGVALLTGCAAGSSSQPSAHDHNTMTCQQADESVVAGLFDRWNSSLQTGDPNEVVKNYAERSILLPTLSGVNRITQEEKVDYFVHFLSSKPNGTVTARQIDIGCNMVADAGLYTFFMAGTGEEVHARYTFTYQWDGQDWLITSHHSSLLPSQK